MPKHSSERLTRREREIMNAIFALGNRASAEDIRTRMTSPPSYSSVRVMLARLEKKGHVKHQEYGLRYILLSHNFAGCGKTAGPSAVPANVLRRINEANDDRSRQRRIVE
jgi:Fe2+ or Zn2+ uptake regulation protein